jgi:HEAT repeat protein
MQDALAMAATAVPAPGDPPEFMAWLGTLMNRSALADDREAAMSALYDLFDPEDERPA